MKLKVIILLVLAALLFNGCSKTTSDNTDTTGDDQQEVSGNLENAFESVNISDTENYSVTRVKQYGDIVDIIDDDNILCLDGKKLIKYNLVKNQYETISENAWNPIVSMDKGTIIYEDPKGIHRWDVKSSKNEIIYELKSNQVTRNAILSRNGSLLLVQLLESDKFKTILITSTGKTSEVPVSDSNEFLISRDLYLTKFRLYALAETTTKINGSQAEAQESSVDFVYVNLSTGEVNNITNNAYGSTVEYIDKSNTENILLKLVEKTTNEEGVVEKETYKIFNTSTEYIYGSSIVDSNIILLKSVDDDKSFITIEEPDAIDPQYPDLVELKYYKNGKESLIGTIFTGAPVEMHLYNNKLIFNSNGDTYMIVIKNK
ncbi:MAG: hypothetical protein HGA49_09855 [Eubacteriaceae bacterium]|nr:hypothetical protein [Eubacteriaceae bacterium]